MRFAAKLITVFCLTLPLLAQTIPGTKAKALDDSEITLPKRGDSKPILLLIGFSHKSGDACGRWNKEVLSQYLTDPQVNYYQIAELQGAPEFVRPMILHSMRKDVPKEQQSRFLPIFADENQWKTLVSYSASSPDHAYLIVADSTGRVFWTTHGPPDDSKTSALKDALAQAAKK
jgi:hypothetical protein